MITPADSLIFRLQQLNGRTVGLLAYSSNTTYDGSKRLILAEDQLSDYHVDYHVEVSDMAYLTLWKKAEKIGEHMIYNCDAAPEVAIELVKRVMKK